MRRSARTRRTASGRRLSAGRRSVRRRSGRAARARAGLRRGRGPAAVELRVRELRARPRGGRAHRRRGRRTRWPLTARGERWLLVNASPDVLRQIERFAPLHPRAARDTPIGAIALTNGDLDHVVGLLSLRESQPLRRAARPSACGPGWSSATPCCGRWRGRPTRSPGGRSSCGREVVLDDVGLGVTASPLPGKLPVHLVGLVEPSPEDNVALRVRDLATGRVLRGGHGGRRARRRRRDRRGARTRVLFDGTFWSEDELVAQGLGKAHARDMAHVPIGGAGREPRRASQGRRAPRLHAHQQHQPRPARGLARARRGRATRDGSSPSTAWRSCCERACSSVAGRLRRAPAPRGGGALPQPAPLQRARCTQGELSRERAPALGAQSLLLPDAHPHQRRAHPLEERRPGLPARVDAAHRATTTAPRRGRGGSRSGCSWRGPWGSTRTRCARCARVLPGGALRVRLVRRARARTRSLVEAVASSLTEHFAPDIMRTRVAAWEKHYPWVDQAALAYFRSRVPRGDARRRGGARLRRGARDDGGAAGGVRPRADRQVPHPLGDARRRGRGSDETAPVAQGARSGPIRGTATRCSSRPSGACASSDTAAAIVAPMRRHADRREPSSTQLAARYGAPSASVIDGDVERASRRPHGRGLLDGCRAARAAPGRAESEPATRQLPTGRSRMSPLSPYTLVAELTHRCPLACPYCSNPHELVRGTRRADDRATGCASSTRPRPSA